MLKMERSFNRRQVSDGTGNPVTLVTERMAVSLAGGRFALGAGYDRPRCVLRSAVATPIFDLVMVARLIGLFAVLLAMIVRTVRR